MDGLNDRMGWDGIVSVFLIFFFTLIFPLHFLRGKEVTFHRMACAALCPVHCVLASTALPYQVQYHVPAARALQAPPTARPRSQRPPAIAGLAESVMGREMPTLRIANRYRTVKGIIANTCGDYSALYGTVQ